MAKWKANWQPPALRGAVANAWLAAQEQPESQKAAEDWEADAVANLLCGEEERGCDMEAAAVYDMAAQLYQLARLRWRAIFL